MTMPYGSTEEPEVIETGLRSVPVHVASSALKTGKSLGTEFGRTKTFVVTNAVQANSITPGAIRILNRSLRRYEARIAVVSGGNVTTASVALPGFPSIVTSGTAIQNPNAFPVSVVLAGFTATQVFVNGILVGASNGTYIVPAFGSLSVTFTVVGTTTASTIASTGAQSSLDGAIFGSREEVTAGGQGGVANSAAVIGSMGGFLPIGKDLVWKSQAELWTCYPSSNVAQVFVTVTDYQWASPPDAYKEYES
jgi:hypothetical protein